MHIHQAPNEPAKTRPMMFAVFRRSPDFWPSPFPHLVLKKKKKDHSRHSVLPFLPEKCKSKARCSNNSVGQQGTRLVWKTSQWRRLGVGNWGNTSGRELRHKCRLVSSTNRQLSWREDSHAGSREGTRRAWVQVLIGQCKNRPISVSLTVLRSSCPGKIITPTSYWRGRPPPTLGYKHRHKISKSANAPRCKRAD
jgi:hypothetical protein